MKQIYKQIYKDEDGKYYFITEEDTRPVVDQNGYLLIYLIEIMYDLLNKEENIEMSKDEMEEEDANL